MYEKRINISVIAIKSREKEFGAKKKEQRDGGGKRQTDPSKVMLCAHSNEPYFVTK